MSKVYLEDSTLTSIANAIRAKTGGSSQITPANMPTEIESISGGGEPLTVSGKIAGNAGGFFEKEIVTNRVTLIPETVYFSYFMKDINKSLFSQTEYENLPSQLLQKLSKNAALFSTNNYGDSITIKAFYATQRIFSMYSNQQSSGMVWTTGPYIIENLDIGDLYTIDNIPSSVDRMNFSGYQIIIPPINSDQFYAEGTVRNYLPCVRPLIKNFVDKNNALKNFFVSLRSKITGADGAASGYGIMHCVGQWYLNSLPDWYIEVLKLISDYNDLNYSDLLKYKYYECYNLKTAYFPCIPYNSLNFAVSNTPRLRHVLFVQGDRVNGGNYISNGSTLYLYPGYMRDTYTNKQDVCPDNKKIYDATSYEALKNDPEAWAYGLEYSFYGHSAAAETLVSLPNQNPCRDGYNRPCTIVFKSNSGLNTDDGPISDLTAEEIAVATNKGWTVTLS